MEMKNTALVLEGGGMRGVFTAGVLDSFMDENISFPYGIGVSAGAGNLLNYLSHQRGRLKLIDIDYLEKYNYIGIHKLITKRSLIDNDFLYDVIPYDVNPYDFGALFSNPMDWEIVTCDCRTATSCYCTERQDEKRALSICRASSSLPFACPQVVVDGIPMLDGGITDPIPIKHAMDKGYDKIVLVLTRLKGYRKDPKGIKCPSFIYKQYPLLQEKLSTRNCAYNDLMDEIEQMESEGKIMVIRPESLYGVSRLGKDVTCLTNLYEHGLEMGKRFLEKHNKN